MSQIYYKVLHINPLPKVSPPKEIQSDFRPISLTCNLVKVMEGFARSRLVSNTRQARPVPVCEGGSLYIGHFNYPLQEIHEATDRGDCGARIFFADFSKCFNMIDHSFLEYNNYFWNTI